MSFVSLHSRTFFSILRALSSPEALFQKAKELNQSAIAITDYCSAAGMADALQESKKTGVKLIPGVELNFVPVISEEQSKDYRTLVFLAKNEQGYKNLLCLIKKGFDNHVSAFKKAVPQTTWEHLEEFKEGLICLSGDGQGYISQLLMARETDLATTAALKLKSIFKDDFYIELNPSSLRRLDNPWSGPIDQNFINRKLKTLAIENDLQWVITPTTFYTTPEEFELHDVLLAINCGHPKFVQSRLKFNTNDFYLQSEEQTKNFFLRHKSFWGESFIQKGIANTQIIADRCGSAEYVDPKYSNPSGKELPVFPVEKQKDYELFAHWRKKLKPPGKLDTDYLKFKCIRKLISLGIRDLTPYKKRLEEELEVLDYKGFCSYMLIVSDFMREANDRGVKTGPGRGSVGGSLIGYLSGLHRLDPLKYGLIFERFINKYKEAYPDADQDIAPSGRGYIKAYLEDLYGANNVANVSNINTITPKVYARDISRSCQFGGDRGAAVYIGDQIASSIPDSAHTFEQAFIESFLFREFCEKYPELVEYKDLCGLPRAWGTHAGGFIIGARSLVGLVPVRRDNDGNLVLEYDKVRAEANGLVKIDILGLTTLDIISHTHELIKEQGKPLPPSPLPLNDPEAYKLISKGKTECVFQLNGAAVHLCKKIKPKNIEEISIINTLVRPAAKDIQDDFIATKDGKKKVELLHPLLERAFKETYGFGLYEECLMVIAEDVAGWDLNDADALRKLTKEKGKNPEKVKKWKEDFIEGAVKNKNLSQKDGEFIWDEVVAKFGAYSFNHCLTGDTIVTRGGANHHDPDPNISLKNLYEGQQSRTSWGEKIRAGKLKLLQYDKDGRLRPRNLKKIFHNGTQEVWRLTTSKGKTIEATASHKLLTPYGYKTVKSLEVGNMLVCCGEKEPYRPQRNRLGKGKGSSYEGKGMPSGKENPSWEDGRTQMFKDASLIVKFRAQGKCEFCGDSESGRFELAHNKLLKELQGDFNKYHNPDNIYYLCNPCHKSWDYKKGERKQRWSRGLPTDEEAIISIDHVGEKEVFDLEMDTEDHNYLANGIVSHNSHSIAYSLTSYETAYLKAHYFLEFLVSNLKFNLASASPKAEGTVLAIKKELRLGGINILPPDINSSENGYKIIDDKTILMGLDSIKFVGKPAQEQILLHRPFSSLEDLLMRTEGRKLRMPAIQALAASGALRSFNQTRKELFLYSGDFKKKLASYDKRTLLNQTGFHYPWPETEEWTEVEQYGLEKHFLGEGLSANAKRLYPGFFEGPGMEEGDELEFSLLGNVFPYKKRHSVLKADRKANSHKIDSSTNPPGLKGILTQFYSFRVKNPDSSIFGEEMARGILEDIWGNELILLVFPEALGRARETIRKLSRGESSLDSDRLALLVEGTFQHEGSTGQIFILEDIVDFKEEPQKPSDKDLKAQKVIMKIAPPRKRVKQYTKEQLKEQLELEMVEQGFSLEKS